MLEGCFAGCQDGQRIRGGGLLYTGCKGLWLVGGITGFGLLDGCLEDCDCDWDRSWFVGLLHSWEDDGEGCCEAGSELGLMKGGADGCLGAYTADSGANWFRVKLFGRK